MRSSSQRRPSIKERRLTEPGLTGACLNALAQAALVYIGPTVIVYMECVTIFIPVDKR